MKNCRDSGRMRTPNTCESNNKAIEWRNAERYFVKQMMQKQNKILVVSKQGTMANTTLNGYRLENIEEFIYIRQENYI